MNMSYAQALNEAKQVIVQQSARIKADAEKTRQLQQTIIDQCSQISEQETKIKDRDGQIGQQASQISELQSTLSANTTAREQAEAVCDRQGQRLTMLQEQIIKMDQTITEQAQSIEKLTSECESYRGQLPSKEDEAALVSMAELLTTKKAAAGSMRISKESLTKAA